MADYLQALETCARTKLYAYGWQRAPSGQPGLKEFTGLLIFGDGRIWTMDETTTSYEIFEPFYAIGSGRDFAIAAMALGKSALEAVELASRFDIWTAAPFTELRLNSVES